MDEDDGGIYLAAALLGGGEMVGEHKNIAYMRKSEKGWGAEGESSHQKRT